MKRCPKCQQLFREETLKFCRADGTPLYSAFLSGEATIPFPIDQASSNPTQPLPETTSSIAILPFTNLTGESAYDCFGDGLADGLRYALSRIENLRVAARTSAVSFKGKDADVREIGRTLRVDAVLDGSVRKSKDRMRITVQLVSARDGYQLWSERFDREMQDMLRVQNEITRAVVTALQVKLRAYEQSTVFKRHTENSNAHQLYIIGREQASTLTADGFRTGVEYLNNAVAEDPRYALAYAGLAEAYYYASSFHLRPAEALLQVRAAAEKALALDEDLAEAHALLAIVEANYDRKPAEAESRFKRALELAPNSVLAHRWYGCYLMTQGRLAAAVGEFCRAQELDPLSPMLRVLTSITYFFARQPYKALREARNAISLDESFWLGYWSAALAHEQLGQLLEALVQLERAEECESSPWITAVRARVYARLGRKEVARTVLVEVNEKAETEWVAPYLVATIHFALGDKEQGFEWLEKAFTQYDEALNFMTVDPLLDAYRTEPQFKELLRRAGLEQSHGKTHLIIPVSGSLKSSDNFSRDALVSSEARRIWI